MRLEIKRWGLTIIPERTLDEAYIEEVLGMKEDGSWVKLVRKNAQNLSCIAFLETEIPQEKEKNQKQLLNE